jgi:ATP-dependent Clp protease ATP-binding subunit ClpC
MNNFTPRAQQVLSLARKEADRFHHNYVGTEHLLLGLIHLGQGVAVNVLQKMGLSLETVRAAVEQQVGVGPQTKTPVGSIPYTPRVKKVLALAGVRRVPSTIPTSAPSTYFGAFSGRARASQPASFAAWTST